MNKWSVESRRGSWEGPRGGRRDEGPTPTSGTFRPADGGSRRSRTVTPGRVPDRRHCAVIVNDLLLHFPDSQVLPSHPDPTPLVYVPTSLLSFDRSKDGVGQDKHGTSFPSIKTGTVGEGSRGVPVFRRTPLRHGFHTRTVRVSSLTPVVETFRSPWARHPVVFPGHTPGTSLCLLRVPEVPSLRPPFGERTSHRKVRTPRRKTLADPGVSRV